MIYPALKLLLVVLGLATLVTAVDRTLQQGAYGSDVVDASVNKILRSNIFPDDFDLLRRLAWIETDDGTNNNTFAPGWFGGIWAVSDLYLYRTKEPSLKNYHDRIRTSFNLTWDTLPWESLTIPLNSAIAARLYIAWLEEQLNPLTPPQTLGGQADLWLEWYNTDDSLDRTVFINETRARESTSQTCTQKMDLVFAVAGTPELGEANFTTAANFVAAMVGTVAVGGTRVSFISYGTNATQLFGLDNGLPVAELQMRIGNATPPTGADNNFNAILEATNAFNASNPRPGVPRILVLFTGSPADDITIKNQSLTQAKAFGLSTFALGFSDSIDGQELLDIAFGIKTNVHAFTSVASLSDFYYRLKTDVCKVHQTPRLDSSVQDVLGPGETRYYKYTDLPSGGISLFRSVLEGDVTAYYSYTEQTPSSAMYDGTLITKVTFIAAKGPATNVYLAVRGSNSFTRNNFVLEGITGPLPCSNTTRVEL